MSIAAAAALAATAGSAFANPTVIIDPANAQRLSDVRKPIVVDANTPQKLIPFEGFVPVDVTPEPGIRNTPPANDTCAGAIPLPASPFSTDTDKATNDVSPSCSAEPIRWQHQSPYHLVHLHPHAGRHPPHQHLPPTSPHTSKHTHSAPRALTRRSSARLPTTADLSPSRPKVISPSPHSSPSSSASADTTGHSRALSHRHPSSSASSTLSGRSSPLFPPSAPPAEATSTASSAARASTANAPRTTPPSVESSALTTSTSSASTESTPATSPTSASTAHTSTTSTPPQTTSSSTSTPTPQTATSRAVAQLSSADYVLTRQFRPAHQRRHPLRVQRRPELRRRTR